MVKLNGRWSGVKKCKSANKTHIYPLELKLCAIVWTAAGLTYSHQYFSSVSRSVPPSGAASPWSAQTPPITESHGEESNHITTSGWLSAICDLQNWETSSSSLQRSNRRDQLCMQTCWTITHLVLPQCMDKPEPNTTLPLGKLAELGH